jgi:hypothetical protein
VSDVYSQGIAFPYDFSNAIVTEIDGVAINFLVNRTPLYSRLPRVQRGSLTFKITADQYRPGTIVLNNGGTLSSGATSVTLADASTVQLGDVYEFSSGPGQLGEAILVTADPNVSANTVTISRGYASTSAGSIADGSTLYLVGNTRTGGEVNQNGINRLPSIVTQNFQTVQFPYQVSGALESATDFALPPGMASFLGRERAYAVQQCADDLERSAYYGYGVAAGSDTSRQQMIGLRGLVGTTTFSPTNAGAYAPTDLIRDVIQPCFDNGGRPSVLLVSTNFLGAFAKWGVPLLRITQQDVPFGFRPDAFTCPFLNDIKVIPCPLMLKSSAFALTEEEVVFAEKRRMFDKPRGSRGDAFEGDVLAEMAIELHNPLHHAYVCGVTTFAPES